MLQPPLPGPDPTPQYRLIHVLLRLLIRGCFRVEVQGREKLPRGPYIIISNHRNWLDALLILVAFPLAPRVWSLAARDIVWNTPRQARFFTFTGGVIPLERRLVAADRAAMTTMVRALARGAIVCLFSEGAVGFREGKIQPFKHGTALLAVQAGVPVVPVGLSGTGQLWLGKRLVVRIGESIRPPVGTGPAARRQARALTEQYERAVRALITPADEAPTWLRSCTARRLSRLLNPWEKNAPLVPVSEPPSVAGFPQTDPVPALHNGHADERETAIHGGLAPHGTDRHDA